MKLEISARTNVGLVRSRNEDSFGVWPDPASDPSDIPGPVTLLSVADGMGGHPGGDVASQAAVQTARALFDRTSGESGAGPLELLREVFASAQRAIRERGDTDPQFREMGTTLSAVVLRDCHAWVGHIGDTRVYWIRGNEWIQITRDHTVAQELVETGRLEAEDAEEHPMSNVLTRCLGVCPDSTPDILDLPLELEPNDLLLLATDGLAKTVHSQAVQDLVVGIPCERGTAQLIEAALTGGAPDNVTVVLARVLEVGDDPPSGRVIRFSDSDPYPWRQG